MNDYRNSLDFLYNLRGAEIDLRLERVAQALALFGDPQDSFRVVHVAGTNGKGSTAAMIHSVLHAEGYRAGLYTSPHLTDFTERIRVGKRLVSRAAVTALVREVADGTSRASLSLTFFEFATVMAFLHFARESVEVAVVEVGLGGRLDATNVVHPSVSVITTISRDHERFLGTRLESIAREKGGIIKPGVPVVCGDLRPAARRVIHRIARSRKARVYQWGEDFAVTRRGRRRFAYRGREWRVDDLKDRLAGEFQRHNAALALASLELLQAELPVREASLRAGIESVSWPGRFEILPGSPAIILDGAHNRGLLDDVKVRLLFGSMFDKEWPSMLRALSRVCSEVVLTRTPTERGADPRSLSAALPRTLPARIVDDPVAALSALAADRRRSDEPILVAGSLYLVGAVRASARKLSAQFPRQKGRPAVPVPAS